jgi:RecF protein
LFQGQNGHGKSNLLEAAYMLAIAKSARSSHERELVSWSLAETGGHMQVLGVGREGDTTVQAQIDVDITAPASPKSNPGFRKGLRVNGIKRSAIDFVGNLNIVFFEADDLEIIHGSPGRRRRYLDILISQSDTSYLKSLQRYSQVVTQRNQLLRRVREGVSEENELEFWDERLAYEGARVTDSRRRAVDGLNDHAVPAHRELTDGDKLELEYRPRITAAADDRPKVGEMNAEMIEAEMKKTLPAIRRREIAQGVTVIGPHRDDRLETKDLVLGLGFDSDPVAFPHSELRTEQLIQLSHAGVPTVVYFDPETDTALAYGAEIDGHSLDFELVEEDVREWLRDSQTGSLWVPFTGQALRGEFAGSALERVHAVNVFWFAWNDFYPETDIWGAG